MNVRFIDSHSLDLAIIRVKEIILNLTHEFVARILKQSDSLYILAGVEQMSPISVYHDAPNGFSAFLFVRGKFLYLD